jgi:hypothetical protein
MKIPSIDVEYLRKIACIDDQKKLERMRHDSPIKNEYDSGPGTLSRSDLVTKRRKIRQQAQKAVYVTMARMARSSILKSRKVIGITKLVGRRRNRTKYDLPSAWETQPVEESHPDCHSQQPSGTALVRHHGPEV